MGEVGLSEELQRIAALPRREWTRDAALQWAERLTQTLKTPHGTMTLRPIQAQALVEVRRHKGAYLGVPIGHGKTLVSALVPTLFPERTRALLLLPAHLISKTEREFAEYRKHWQIRGLIRLESYQTMGRVGAARFLEGYQPDIVIADEADFLKNPSAAVTRRVMRYLKEHKPIFVPMTGTPISRGIRDVSQLMYAALGVGSPVPRSFLVLDEWSRALDYDIPDHRRIEPGALAMLGPVGDLQEARHTFRARLRETPGSIFSADPPEPVRVVVSAHSPEHEPCQTEAFEILRQKWETPDGIACMDAMQIWRHAREIATGFYAVWVPRAPGEWTMARSAWGAACREILGSNRLGLDSEEAVKIAVRGGYRPDVLQILDTWETIRPCFVPNPTPHWITDSALDWIRDWGRLSPGLIWTDRPAVGERLGLPYYGEDGVDQRTGRFVDDDPGTTSITLSRRANDSGRNLQHKWSRNLVVDIPSGSRAWQQMLGRTVRPGQKADTVSVDLLVGCIEDAHAIWRAIGRAGCAQDVTGQPQILCHADITHLPTIEHYASLSGPAWSKTL